MSSTWNFLPDAFRARAPQLLPADALTHWQACFTAEPPVVVRWHGPDDAKAACLEALAPLEPTALEGLTQVWHLQQATREQVRALPWWASGQLVLQSAASIAAVQALHVEPGMDVLDLCAAPGGKTALLHAHMKGEGRLVANDVSKARLGRLADQLSHLGVDGVQTLCSPGAALATDLPACFDRVLVDAPCSGEGRWHGGAPKAWAQWSPAGVRRLAKRQVDLLEAACTMVRPGGRVVYSTCTLAPEENEGVLTRVCRSRPEMSLVSTGLNVEALLSGMEAFDGRAFHEHVHLARRMVPGLAPWTGFFVAALQRAD